MWPRFHFKEQALVASVWEFVVGARLHRAAAVAPTHFSSTATEQESEREQRKGLCFSCDIWGQFHLLCRQGGGRKSKIRAKATHWRSWLYLGMCKLVDTFPEYPLPQSGYELQQSSIFFFFFFFSQMEQERKKFFPPKGKYWIMSSTFILFTPIWSCRISSLQQLQQYIAIGSCCIPTNHLKKGAVVGSAFTSSCLKLDLYSIEIYVYLYKNDWNRKWEFCLISVSCFILGYGYVFLFQRVDCLWICSAQEFWQK